MARPCRDPSRCIVPDYMLREIARRGGPAERDAALRTLGVSSTLRSSRTQAEARRAARRVAPLATVRPAAKNRIIRDAHNGTDTRSPAVRSEGDGPSGDVAVDEAFEYFGATWDFFFEVFARDSLDNAGLPLDGVVHFDRNFDNAFWNGEQLIFGDGDGTIFTRMTQSISVCAHELGHGVVQYDGPLAYQGQSGALNEHVADAFGVMVDQWRHGQSVDQADWLVGKEILGATISGKALRSVKDPGTAYDDALLGKDPQPAHMDHYVPTVDDNGGVHINSGIPNRAFYEIAAALGGSSWEHAGRILYATLGHPQLRETADFRRFARLNAAVAGTLYGPSSREHDAVVAGWEAVGVAL